jgi:hypothetical protein
MALPKGNTFDQVVIAEEIEKGQRVREFSLQVYKKRKWQTIITGTSVGHKYITRLAQPVSGEKVRLIISKSIGQPYISKFALY